MRYDVLYERARGFLADWLERGEVVALAPVRESVDDIVRRACERAVLGVHRFSLRQFIQAVSSRGMNDLGLVPITRVAREAVTARVVRTALRAGELTHFGGVAEFPGFPRALAKTIEDLRLNRVQVSELQNCGQSGQDLAHLLTAYGREIDALHFADHATRVGIALNAVVQKRHSFSEMPILLLDSEPETQIEAAFVDALLMNAPAGLKLNLASDDAPVQTSLQSLQRYLFSELNPPPPRPIDSTFSLFSSSGEALECVEIARKILLAANDGVRFDEIAILLRSVERYQPLIAEGLRRAGIPAYFSRGSRRPDPAGRSFLALLRCAQEGLSASRFAEYISLSQFPDGELPRSGRRWERFLNDAAVIGGKDRWERRLHGLAEELRRAYGLAQDESDRTRLAARLGDLEDFCSFALPLIERVSPLANHTSWEQWLGALHELASAALKDTESVDALLEQLAPLSEISPVNIDDVLLVLSEHLTTARSEREDTRYGKVFVGSVVEARGLVFRAVFLPGVNEGMFPRPIVEDPLLLDAQRETLGLRPPLNDSDHIRLAIASASEQITISFSRLDLLTGRERVPSFYAFAAYRAAGGSELDVREFEAIARRAVELRIAWPAPSSPENAIDEAEFDLAALRGRTKGSGQYLKQLPGRAVHSLRARWQRWHKPWKAADGLIIEQIGNDLLATSLLSRKPYSPSALQDFAKCPYRFALRSIFGLRPTEKPVAIEKLDALTRGSLFHQVQFQLFRTLEIEKRLPVDNSNLPRALELVDSILDDIAAKEIDRLAPAIPQVWKMEIESLRADLRGWLQYKAAIEPDWTPIRFELAFGLGDEGRDPRSSTDCVELLDGFRIVGAIDLIERHSAGILRVVDHKTGKFPEPKPEITGAGEFLQPGLYAMAAEQLLNERVMSGRLFYSTIRQNYRVLEIPLNDAARRRLEEVLKTIETSIRDGFLPAAPRKDACKNCDYQQVCGPYEEERLREKSQPELKSLKEIRKWR